LNKLSTMAELHGKAVELQQIILAAQSSALSAQSEQFSLIERIRQLEKEIADVKAWETTKERYDLEEVASGIFTYVLKPGVEPPEPSHWICTKCYEDGRRSILQLKGTYYGQRHYTCFHCDKEIAIPGGDDERPRPLVRRKF